MRRRSLAVLLATPLLSLVAALPAQAADVKPLKLDSSVTVEGPSELQYGCTYSGFNCGVIVVQAAFSGLEGRSHVPTARVDLTGSAKVTETYGCADDVSGDRLRAYDTKVRFHSHLDTRRGAGFALPATGDTVNVTIYGALFNYQPSPCPAGTTSTLYEIRATDVKVDLPQLNEDIPAATYAVPGHGVWTGAAQLPLPVYEVPA